MFSDEFRQRLAVGKYARWAVDLNEQQLEALIWMVGEYAARADLVLNLLEEHKGAFSVHDEAFARVRHALEALAGFVAGDRPDLETSSARVREVVARARALTDDEWSSRRHAPFEMLAHSPLPPGQRKSRLLAVAFCRRVWHLFRDDRLRRAVEVAERYADGLATEGELAAARETVEAASGPQGGDWRTLGTAAFDTTAVEPWAGDAAGAAATNVGLAAAGLAERPDPSDGAAWSAYCDGESGEEAVQCDLVRDVFGNPFRPVTFDPRWRSADALALAQGIYAERAFDRLPILADALEEAGCTEKAVLDHCRRSAVHVRGCWVVDLVLGKE
jgi:hypothetical protein